MDRPSEYSSLRRLGDFKESARKRDHNGWLLLDGRTIQRSAYPKLFDALEVAGPSLTLPDGKDCILVGAGGRLKLMERGGANEILLTADNLPEHDHKFVDATAEATTAKGGLLTGVLTVFSGLTAKTADKVTAKTGKGVPVKITPLAIGVNYFIYAGEAMK